MRACRAHSVQDISLDGISVVLRVDRGLGSIAISANPAVWYGTVKSDHRLRRRRSHIGTAAVAWANIFLSTLSLSSFKPLLSQHRRSSREEVGKACPWARHGGDPPVSGALGPLDLIPLRTGPKSTGKRSVGVSLMEIQSCASCDSQP